MAKRKQNKLFFFIIFWVILIVSFIFSAFLIILKAQGWQLNYKTWKIVHTGMIILNGDPSNAQVTLNGRIISQHLPTQIRNLSPGNYQVVISRPDYWDWQRTINVSQSKAETLNNIILFLKNPQDAEADKSLTVDKLIQQSANFSQDLRIQKNEIYFQGNLITRFSQNVLTASLYPDNQHIVFQINNEVRVIEIDGSNNTLLFNLNSTEPTFFSYVNDGKQIYYLDQGQIKTKVIR